MEKRMAAMFKAIAHWFWYIVGVMFVVPGFGGYGDDPQNMASTDDLYRLRFFLKSKGFDGLP